MGFLNISDEAQAEIHTIPKTWEKWILIIYRGKVWEKRKHFKILGFSNTLGEAEIHTIPKIWEKWFPIVREKYGKTQTFQSQGFLEFFPWSRNPGSSQNVGKVDCPDTGKVWENRNILNLWVS